MQPVLILSAREEGIVYVNGRFAGETGADQTLVMPVAPRGPVYLEYRRFGRSGAALTGRITLSGGTALPESVTDGLYIVMWPGGAIQADFVPDETAAQPREIDVNGRVLEPLHDTVGHALLWRRGDSGEEISEVLWQDGAPRWPTCARDTALAAVEAALLCQYDEARGYFTPAALARGAMDVLLSAHADGAAHMRYGEAARDNAVGLVTLAGERAARVKPLYYRAVAMGGAQGSWRIDDISVEPI